MVQHFIAAVSTNEPRLMVSTDGVADIPVQGNLDYTNHFGIAVVPLISSYQPSTVAVNMNDLPDGVTVAENVIKETWIEGAMRLQITRFLVPVKTLTSSYATPAVSSLPRCGYPPG